uniref:Ribosomal protein S3 n=1 Tax=Picea glauca TaxID=3330 RepID=A0A117NGH3_PICGL|nr:ribosomal protein S3 [Picea glauca]
MTGRIAHLKHEGEEELHFQLAQDISFQPRDRTRSFRSILSQIVRDIPLVMPKGDIMVGNKYPSFSSSVRERRNVT